MSRCAHLLALVAWVATCWFSVVSADFVSESLPLVLQSPSALKGKSYQGFLANFGQSVYGASKEYILYYPNNDYLPASDQHSCGDLACNYACSDLQSASPAVAPPDNHTDYMLVVDRGPVRDGRTACSFVDKAYAAQQAGFQAVLVLSFEDVQVTMDAPNDATQKKKASDVFIPAFYMQKTPGDDLRSLLKLDNGRPSLVQIAFDATHVLPESSVVEIDIWRTTENGCGVACDTRLTFLQSMQSFFSQLLSESRLNWQSHIIIWQCPSYYTESSDCTARCYNGGRYCAQQPEGSAAAGYNGRDVMQMNVRDLCAAKQAELMNAPDVWFNYTIGIAQRCTMASQLYTPACAAQVFDGVVGNNATARAAWRACSNMLSDDDVAIPMLDQEYHDQENGESDDNTAASRIIINPTVRIDGVQYRGDLNVGNMQQAVCAAYNDTQLPSICSGIDAFDTCSQGHPGWLDCHSEKNVAKGMTRCRSYGTAQQLYECACEAGYIEAVNSNGPYCSDYNECFAATPACDGGLVCHNINGGFECVQVDEQCTPQNNFGGCWRDGNVSACVSHRSDVVRDLNAGTFVGNLSSSLHSCSCPHCYTLDANNDCVYSCSGATSSLSAAGIIGVAVAAAVVSAVGLVMVRTMIRRYTDAAVRQTMKLYGYAPLDEQQSRTACAADNHCSVVSTIPVPLAPVPSIQQPLADNIV